MSHQTVGLSIQSPLSTISVLVLHLLLVSFAGGQSQLTGSSQPIVATVGDDIILPCHLEPAEDVTAKLLEWSRSNLQPSFVYVWRSRQELVDVKHPLFSGRTSLFTDELKHGNISLKLSRVKPADEGRYRCLILDKGTESFVELLVGAASSPVISLAGADRDKGSVVLQCESKGWYPEPELLWLDAEGEQLSAGPTQTVRGPDDLYTVSSRVTVEKTHKSNNFTCRVQQKTIHQSRDTQIHVPDDFFKVQSSSAPVITALAVTLAVSIIISLVFYVWKKRQNLKTKRRQRDEEEREREKLLTEEKMELEKQLKQKQDELQRVQGEKDKQIDELQSLMMDLEIKNKQIKQKQAELQALSEDSQRTEDKLKKLKEKLKNNNSELEMIRNTPGWSFWHRQTPTREELEKEAETLDKELKTKNKELSEKRYELLQLILNHCQTLEKNHETSSTMEDKPDKGSIIWIDPAGTYVRLRNDFSQSLQLWNWTLHLEFTRKKETVRFRESLLCQPGWMVTLWEKQRDNKNPRETGDLVKATLTTPRGEIVDMATCTRQ